MGDDDVVFVPVSFAQAGSPNRVHRCRGIRIHFLVYMLWPVNVGVCVEDNEIRAGQPSLFAHRTGVNRQMRYQRR